MIWTLITIVTGLTTTLDWIMVRDSYLNGRYGFALTGSGLLVALWFFYVEVLVKGERP